MAKRIRTASTLGTGFRRFSGFAGYILFILQILKILSPTSLRFTYPRVITDIAPSATALTHQHRKATVGDADPLSPTGPNGFDNLRARRRPARSTTPARFATPPNVQTSRTSPRETPTRRDVRG